MQKRFTSCSRYLLCLALLLSNHIIAFPQSLNAYQKRSPTYAKEDTDNIIPLKIGDKIPAIEIHNISNYRKKTINLSELKGKVIILDFWETFCSPCIGALPKIQKLQEKFGDKVQVITITRYNTIEKIINQVQRSVTMKEFKLPTVTHDQKMFKYFPFQFLSHVVWINTEGIVTAFTGTEHLTEENVQTVIEGKPVGWPVKIDLINFSYEKPLMALSDSEVNVPDFLFYSALTGPLEGVDGTARESVDSIKRTITFNTFNTTILDLCKGAIDGQLTGNFDLKEVVFNVQNPERYNVKNNKRGYYWTAKGNTNNTFCYSITMPLKTAPEERKRIIGEDISKWLSITLGITVKKERRLVDVLVLRRSPQPDVTFKPIQTKGETDGTIILKDEVLQFKNVPFKHLKWYLNNNADSIPYVIDETGISPEQLADLNFPIKALSNLSDLKKALQKYGLELVEGKRERDMYIITEKGFEENPK